MRHGRSPRCLVRKDTSIKASHPVRFWGLRLSVGSVAKISVPPNDELRITSAFVGTPDEDVSSGAVVVLSPCAEKQSSDRGTTLLASACCRFRVGRDFHAGLPARIVGIASRVWNVEARISSAAGPISKEASVDLVGYFCRRPAAKSQGPRRRLVCRGQSALKDLPTTGDTRVVRLPSGWAGLSFKSAEGDASHLVVTDVPKACFSSAAFGASAAAQVSGVEAGDEIVAVNGQEVAKLAARIVNPGDALNTCCAAAAVHTVGSVGKKDSPPCISCDFMRRRRDLGIDVALQMWMRAVKRDIPITLTVRSKCSAEALAPVVTATSKPVHANPKGSVPPAAIVPPVKSSDPATGVACPPKAAYNPLRPAAASAAASSTAKPKADAGVVRARPVASGKAGGFAYEDKTVGAGAAATLNQDVEFRFSLRLARKEAKVVERGEIRCRLGQSEIVDGWTDGSVDMEQVLKSWSAALVGTRVGGSRRIRIPPRSGFRDGGGGEVIPSGSEVLFDVDVKKIR